MSDASTDGGYCFSRSETIFQHCEITSARPTRGACRQMHLLGRKMAGFVAESCMVPPPDGLAVYLPFHRYPDMWGVYLLDAGVASFATDLRAIVRLLGRSVTIHDARRVAVTYLFHHRTYHNAVEAFGLRCELPLRRPVYRTGLRKLYTRRWIWGLHEPHEEALATAYGIRTIRDNLRPPEPDLDTIENALLIYMTLCRLPYQAGGDITHDRGFDFMETRFMEEAIRLTYSKPADRTSKPLDDLGRAWTMATCLMTPISQRSRKYSWIYDRADFGQKSKLGGPRFPAV